MRWGFVVSNGINSIAIRCDIVMIVSGTRNDLRDEFAMADEAFALSPISARATLPSEEDYDAIREAFMETSRGRWFLSEYAKRNRNADTHMVLDAVARIEHSIAAQKQAPATGLIESLGAIRAIVHDAKAAATQAMSTADGHATLIAARDGARVIREIAGTLRECGADIRICDLLDTQLAAIDSGHREIAAISHRDAVLASFDLLMLQIGDLAAGDALAAAPQAEAPPQPAEPAAAARRRTRRLNPTRARSRRPPRLRRTCRQRPPNPQQSAGSRPRTRSSRLKQSIGFRSRSRSRSRRQRSTCRPMQPRRTWLTSSKASATRSMSSIRRPHWILPCSTWSPRNGGT